MLHDQALELIPNQASLVTPLFPDEKSYRDFRERFTEAVLPEMEANLEKRRRSEQDAGNRILN